MQITLIHNPKAGDAEYGRKESMEVWRPDDARPLDRQRLPRSQTRTEKPWAKKALWDQTNLLDCTSRRLRPPSRQSRPSCNPLVPDISPGYG